jgi:hypothetical protein
MLFPTRRCLYVAYAYLAAHKYADASALCDRTIEHVGAALAMPSLASNQVSRAST